MKLLKANHECGRGHFCLRESDNMLCYEDTSLPEDSSEADFQTALDNFLKTVSDSSALWSVPGENDQPLGRTLWSGSEELDGYGDLKFDFSSDGDVVMIDKDGKNAGTCSIEKNRITMSFYNNTVVYTGTINGRQITGTATNGTTTWNFSVTRE